MGYTGFSPRQPSMALKSCHVERSGDGERGGGKLQANVEHVSVESWGDAAAQ